MAQVLVVASVLPKVSLAKAKRFPQRFRIYTFNNTLAPFRALVGLVVAARVLGIYLRSVVLTD